MSWHNDYISIPFKERGRTREGADCWGLQRIVYQEKLNINLPDYSDLYSDIKDKVALPSIIEMESANWQKIEPGNERPFDAIILRMRGLPMHVGLVVRKDYMLHCSEGVGTSFESYTNSKWKTRVIGFCRYVR